EHICPAVDRLDLARHDALTFEAPDPARFPCLALAYDAPVASGTAPAVLNAANEIAVAAFLDGRARYTDIAPTCAQALSKISARPVRVLDDALAADAEARAVARAWLKLPAEALLPAA